MDMNLRVETPRGPAQATGATVPGGKAEPSGGKKLPAERQPEVRGPSVAQALAQIQSYLQQSQRALEFQVDNASGRTVIRVINPGNGELIRQIPSEEVLQIAASLDTEGFRLVNQRV